MSARPIVAAILASFIAGCSFSGGSTPPSVAVPERTTIPQVQQLGKGAQWVTFNVLPTLGAGIVLGPDNNVWFLDENGASLARVTESGTIKEFSLSGTPAFSELPEQLTRPKHIASTK